MTATSMLPSSMADSFDATYLPVLSERREALRATLAPHLGEPYLARGGFLLYHSACELVLAAMAKTGVQVDLTVTSPPYNIGKAYEEPMAIADYVAWCTDWMTRTHAVTGPNGAFWLNLGYLEVAGKGHCVPIPYLLWDKSPFFLVQEVVWAYGAGVAARNRLSPRNEKWLYYVKDANAYTFNLDAIRDPDVKYPLQKKHGKLRCNPLGKNPTDVWMIPKVTSGANRSSRERAAHPAQFPLPVVERIIRAASNHGSLVFDPFAGSGSTGIAATALNRVFIGAELDGAYCATNARRYEQVMALLTHRAATTSLPKVGKDVALAKL